MNEIAIIVPTLNRPHLLFPLAWNVANTTPSGQYSGNFVVDADDVDSQRVVTGIEGPVGLIVTSERGYPHATNLGVHATEEPLLLLANDDVFLHEGWHEALISNLAPWVQVVGTNDLSPHTADGINVTMPIVRRSYINELGGNYNELGNAYHEGYWHNFAETELWQLASHRRVARWVENCVIEHKHPDWGKGPMDSTYEQGAKQRWDDDAALFEQRKALWMTTS
jgi:GT2 family glycosyltransferase